MHAMPLMIGVLCCLAIAFRFYSRFLATKVAVLDDSASRPPTGYYDGQNYDPTNKWVLFGHHFAAISGAGPLIGPVLAIQFGYLPGLLWIVIGVCLAGAVQDMLVLAASVRHGGRSLAEIARIEVGRLAGNTASITILFVVIVALAGLGNHRCQSPRRRGCQTGGGNRADADRKCPPGNIQSTEHAITPSCRRAPKSRTLAAAKSRAARRSRITRPKQPDAAPLSTDGGKLTLPPGVAQAVPGSSWGTFTIACTIPIALFVGLYMYKLRKGKILGSLADRRSGNHRRHDRGALDSRLGVGAIVLPFPRRHDQRPLHLRIRRLGLAGVAAALPARLSVELSEDRHGRAARHCGASGQSETPSAAGESAFRLGRRAVFRRSDLSVLLHLHHVRRDFRLPRPGVVWHHAEDDFERIAHSHDRLRRDADRRAWSAWWP